MTRPETPNETEARTALADAPGRWQGWRPVALVLGGVALVNAAVRLTSGDSEGAITALAVGLVLVGVAIAAAWLWHRSRMAQVRRTTGLVPVTVVEVRKAVDATEVQVRLDDGTTASWFVADDRGLVVPGQSAWSTPVRDGAMVRLVVAGPGSPRVLEPVSPAAIGWNPRWREQVA